MKPLLVQESVIDLPQAGDSVYDQCISISGRFALNDETSGDSLRLRAFIGQLCIGETQLFSWKNQVRGRYRLLTRLPDSVEAPRDALIELFLTREKSLHRFKVGEVPVRVLPALLHERAYGEVVYPQRTDILHRENIYGSGPPLEQPGSEFLQLLLDYLSAPGSVVDVGCGAGAYGPPLITAGYRWLGLEINANCWELLHGRQLPFRKIEEPPTLPCASEEFDYAVCLEVLEHTEEPDEFLREIARVIRRRAVVSVPNIEVIPYFRSWEVVPWHLLEADHKNFFTRSSLAAILQKYFSRVEVFLCGAHPLPTRDGIPLHVHLFAVAEK